MKYILRFLALGALLYLSGSACRAQSFDYYTLEYWSCNPGSCDNEMGPTDAGLVNMEVKGQCYDGISVDAMSAAYASGCTDLVTLTSHGDTVASTITDDNGTVYPLDGVRSQSWVNDANTGLRENYSYAINWCDGGEEGFSTPSSGC